MTPGHNFLIPSLALAIIAGATMQTPTSGQETTGSRVSYHRDVMPILKARCAGCHRPGKRKGKLDLSTYDALIQGGETGPAFLAGDPAKSLMVEMIRGAEPDMPAKGKPLTPPQIATIEQWVKEGGKQDSPPDAPVKLTAPASYRSAPPIPAIAFSPDGSILAVAGYYEILLHDGEGLGLLGRLIGPISRLESLAFSTDGKQLAAVGGAPSQSGDVQIWNLTTRTLTHSYKVANDTLFGVSFSKDGSRLAFGCADKAIRILRIQDGKVELHFKSHAEWTLATCFSSDGKQLVSAGRDSAMKIIDLATGRFIDDINNPIEPILDIARHPTQDTIVYAGAAGTPRIYRISDNQKRTSARRDTNLVRKLEKQKGPVHSVAFSQDGKRILAGGADPAVRVHDAGNGRVLHQLTGHSGPVFAVAFHPKSNVAVTAGFDGQLRFYAASDGKLIRTANSVPTARTGASANLLITKITATPRQLVLLDGRDQRGVLVTGTTADGRQVDLTGQSELQVTNDLVTVGTDNYLSPKKTGTGTVLVKAAGMVLRLPVEVHSTTIEPVHFARHVMPVLNKSGCTAGTCHGAQAGQNGFVLSLRGYDSKSDYSALVHELGGRRFDRVNPAQSLLLLKSTAGIPHEGEKVLHEGSRNYQLLLDWISEGTKYRSDKASEVTALHVIPNRIDLPRAGSQQQVLVIAHYADGSTADVTREASLSVSNIEVSKMQGNTVTALRRGESAVLVRYEGRYTTAPMAVMGNRSGFAWQAGVEHNFIDKHVNAKLQRIKALPSELCTDPEFIRRLYLDLTGKPPTPAAAQAFMTSRGSQRDRREKLIDELIGSPAYVDHWANKWADLLQCNSKTLGAKGVWVFRRWITQAVTQNTPYDEFVRKLLTARGSTYKNAAANYMRTLSDKGRTPDTGKMTEDITQTFLGVRFSCNKCHNHPFERWTQNQYYEFSANFARVRYKPGNDPGELVIYDSYSGGETKHPKTSETIAPNVPYGDHGDSAVSRRQAVADWLTSKDNPYFARSYVNRIWSYFFGLGIIDPVDDIRAGNPPSNPELLGALEDQFIASKFNFNKLVRKICRSHTWQRSFRTNKWNIDDTINFSHCVPRRLSAEQLTDAIAVATAVPTKLAGLPPGTRAVEAADGTIKGNDFLELFGRPKRDSACECARTNNLSLSHALNLVGGETIHNAIVDPKCRVSSLIKKGSTDSQIVKELFWASLSRPPSKQELSSLAKFGEGASRLLAAQDLLWALTNSPAFLFNR